MQIKMAPLFNHYFFYVFLFYLVYYLSENVSIVHSARLAKYDGIEIDLGEELNIDRTTNVDSETLKKVMSGVENGVKESIYFFGLMKLYGISLSKNTTVAASSFKRAGEMGHKEALTAHGVCLMSGTGVTMDYSLAVHYFKRAADLGDTNAYWLLGRMLLEGKGVSQPSYTEALGYFKVAAEVGEVAQAEHFLGLMYEYGLGTDQNFAQAQVHYKKASGMNFVESMYNLGLMYAYGRGFDQDYSRAMVLFEGASRVNHAPSVYFIGIFKLYGYGTKIDYEQAYNWFERAASLGDDRVTQKASDAANEIRLNLDKAREENDAVIAKYQARNDIL
jgi:hypothetical protein